MPKRLRKVPASTERADEHLEKANRNILAAKLMSESKYLDYVKKAKPLSKKYADSLEQARIERIKASYGLGEIDSQEASKILSDARDFVAEITGVVEEAKGFGYLRMGMTKK